MAAGAARSAARIENRGSRSAMCSIIWGQSWSATRAQQDFATPFSSARVEPAVGHRRLAYWRKSAASGSEEDKDKGAESGMDFSLTEREAYYRDRVRDFIETRIRPRNKDYKSQLETGDRW